MLLLPTLIILVSGKSKATHTAAWSQSCFHPVLCFEDYCCRDTKPETLVAVGFLSQSDGLRLERSGVDLKSGCPCGFGSSKRILGYRPSLPCKRSRQKSKVAPLQTSKVSSLAVSVAWGYLSWLQPIWEDWHLVAVLLVCTWVRNVHLVAVWSPAYRHLMAACNGIHSGECISLSVKAKFRIPSSAPSLVWGLLYNSRFKQEPAEVMNSNAS